MHERKSLSDILHNGDRESLQKAWNETQAAVDLGPLPAGEYVARIVEGEPVQSRSNRTPGYRLTFKVVEGDFVNRRFWQEIWLTPAALPMAKRDLAKLGVQSLEQLETPLPQGIRVKARLALRKNDAGEEHNAVKSFEVVGIDTPEVDAFAPQQGGPTT